MIRLDDIGLFIRVASTGSFSAAARDANLLPSQVSVAVRRLEGALGVDLFVRSTRSLRLTRKGEQYLPHAEEILSAVRVGRDSVRSRQAGFDGELSVSVPSDIGRNMLSGWIAAFHREHPSLRVRLVITDGRTDGVQVDAGIKFGDETREDQAHAILAKANRSVLVASPGYLTDHGVPATLGDLSRHECIVACGPEHELQVWHMYSTDGEMVVRIHPAWCTDDGDLARRWAMQGMGIALRPWLEVARDVLSGTLSHVLPQHYGARVPLALSCITQRAMPPVLKALSNHLAGHLGTFLRAHPPPFPP